MSLPFEPPTPTGFCRKDPIIIFTNNRALRVDATVNDDPSNISKIDYAVAIPSGFTVGEILLVGDGGVANENVTTSLSSNNNFNIEVTCTLNSGRTSVNWNVKGTLINGVTPPRQQLVSDTTDHKINLSF